MRKAHSAIAKSLGKMMILGLVVVVSVVVLHEAGHYLAGRAIGCSNVEVVLLDSEYQTYTKMNCQNPSNLMFLSGLVLILPLSVVLLFFNRSYSLIIFGFNLLVSSSDFSYFPVLFSQFAMITGFLTVMGGEASVVNYHLKYLEKSVPSFFR
jgi:hypothetical protein